LIFHTAPNPIRYK